MKNLSLALCLSSSLFAACATDTAVEPTSTDPQMAAADEAAAATATKKIYPTIQTAKAAAAVTPAVSQNGINYHGGSVMTSTHNSIYYIWYGNWAGNTAQAILENFGANLGGTPWYNIQTSYTDRNGLAVANKVHFAKSVFDNYSHGKNLDDAAIEAIVGDHIANGDLPINSNAVYFVLTSADVMETSGFCTQYCGWHYFGTIAGHRLKYSFIGNVDQCPTACSTQQVSPNNNVGADGMASIIAHELAEAVSDPYLAGWYETASGMENADKCAWTFGTEQTASNGSQYNMTVNGMNYLVQQNWVNANGGSCAMSF